MSAKNIEPSFRLIGRSTAKINITTNEEISMVTYEIDGNSCPLTIFTKPPYDMKIQKPLIYHFRMKGKHKLGVHVSTISGKTAYDEIDFYALTPI